MGPFLLAYMYTVASHILKPISRHCFPFLFLIKTSKKKKAIFFLASFFLPCQHSPEPIPIRFDATTPLKLLWSKSLLSDLYVTQYKGPFLVFILSSIWPYCWSLYSPLNVLFTCLPMTHTSSMPPPHWPPFLILSYLNLFMLAYRWLRSWTSSLSAVTSWLISSSLIKYYLWPDDFQINVLYLALISRLLYPTQHIQLGV